MKPRADSGDGAGGAGQTELLAKLKNRLDSGAVGSQEVAERKRT